MSRELVPMKVIIRLGNNGRALYPKFNNLSTVESTGMDWAKYVDVHGLGWHYDKTCGHKEETIDSPFGTQIGVLVVPKVFVNEAVSTFPDDCSRLTESELEEFYDNKAHVKEPDEVFDMKVLEGIQAKSILGIELTSQQLDAIDSEKDVPGIQKNKKKHWKDYKKTVNVTIDES